MRSFVSWIAAGLSSLLLAGRADGAGVPRALAARVAQRFADEWKVPVEQVRLSWGVSTALAPGGEDAPFRVLGRGEDGWFVIALDPAGSHAAAVRVRAGVERPVLVATRALPPGVRLAGEDVREETRVRWGIPADDALTAPGPGWEVRRALRSGEVLVPPAVAAPPLVVAGQPVRLQWSRGGVEVSVVGIALNNARQGETVRARLEERPARLTGTVTAAGTAALASGEVR